MSTDLVGVSRFRRFFPELESLRGIAVLLVFLVHADQLVWPIPTPLPRRAGLLAGFVRNGRSGVDIFFVLSGFLLSLPFIQDIRGGRRVVVGEYLARRALRILPLYYLAVVSGSLLTSTHPSDLRRGVPLLFFLDSLSVFWGSMYPYNVVWWSVITEAQFYLALPLVAVLLRTPRLRWCGSMILIAYAVAYGAYLGAGPVMRPVQG